MKIMAGLFFVLFPTTMILFESIFWLSFVIVVSSLINSGAPWYTYCAVAFFGVAACWVGMAAKDPELNN